MIRRLLLPAVCLALVLNAPTLPGQPPVFTPERDFSADPNIPGNPRHEQAKQRAEQAHQQGNYQQAIELTTSVLGENDRDHVAYYLRGSARVELGVSRGDPKLVRDGIDDARNAIRHGGSDEVIYYFPYLHGMTNLSALEDRDEHARVAVEIAGQVLSQQGLNAQNRANLLYQRATAHLQLDEPQKAIADFQQALESNPRHFGVLVALPDAYAADGQTDKATEAFRRAVETYPEDPLVYNNRGMFYRERDRLDEAIADFTRALELNENYYFAYINRGHALMAQGKPAEAEADFSEAVRRTPEHPVPYQSRGDARLAQGKLDGALEDYAKAVELAPEDATVHADLGFARLFADDFRGAQSAFDRALQRDSEMDHLKPWKCAAMTLAGENEAAAREFSDAVRSSEQRNWPDRLVACLLGEVPADGLLQSARSTTSGRKADRLCEAHYFIGLRHRQQDNQQQARQHFQKALETGANHLPAYRGAQYTLGKFSTSNSP